jgi:hypothetical protein
MTIKTLLVSSLLALLGLVFLAGWSAADKLAAGPADDLRFTDVQAQTAEFLGYYKTIQLTPAQEAVKKEPLSAIPAPCCSNNAALTCCCPCNLAKSWWGLTHYLIAKKGYDATQVRAKVGEWIYFVNPSSFPGDTCPTGGCGRPFNKSGCGGMSEPVVY